MKLRRSLVVWRYSTRSRVKHAIRLRHVNVDGTIDRATKALCGEIPPWRLEAHWQGEANSAEWQILNGMRECSRCAKAVSSEA